MAIAWRNVMRNKKRSFITIFAIAIGVVATVILWSLLAGIYDAMLDNMTGLYMGHMQITDSRFLEEPLLENAIIQGRPVFDILDEHPDVVAYAPRLRAFGMIQNADTVQGVAFMGIDPSQEEGFGRLDEFVLEGRWLRDDDEDCAVVGETLAKNLNIELNSELIPHTINRWQDFADLRNMTVVGILKTNVPEIDGAVVIMRRDVLANSLFETSGITVNDPSILPKYGPEGVFTELSIKVKDRDDLEDVKKDLSDALEDAYIGLQEEYKATLVQKIKEASDDERAVLEAALEDPLPRTPIVRTWGEIVPWVDQVVKMDIAFGYILLAILLSIVIAGILNTVLMSVLERTREFGIMRALGTSRRQITFVVSLEAVMLGVVGIAIGAVLGSLLSVVLGEVGINMYGAMDDTSVMGQFYVEPIVYPQLNPLHLVINCSIILILVIIFSLYPARKAAKMEPVEAIKALG